MISTEYWRVLSVFGVKMRRNVGGLCGAGEAGAIGG